MTLSGALLELISISVLLPVVFSFASSKISFSVTLSVKLTLSVVLKISVILAIVVMSGGTAVVVELKSSESSSPPAWVDRTPPIVPPITARTKTAMIAIFSAGIRGRFFWNLLNG